MTGEDLFRDQEKRMLYSSIVFRESKGIEILRSSLINIIQLASFSFSSMII